MGARPEQSGALGSLVLLMDTEDYKSGESELPAIHQGQSGAPDVQVTAKSPEAVAGDSKLAV
jgi:hypothetical protein